MDANLLLLGLAVLRAVSNASEPLQEAVIKAVVTLPADPALPDAARSLLQELGVGRVAVAVMRGLAADNAALLAEPARLHDACVELAQEATELRSAQATVGAKRRRAERAPSLL